MFEKKKELSEEELFKYLKHDWYRVDVDENDRRMIDIMGYAYESVDTGCGQYRIVDYSRFYIDPMDDNGFDLEDDRISRIVEPCDKEKVLTYLRNVASLPHLPFNRVDGTTPEGYYHT